MVAWTSQEGSGSDMAAFVLSKFIQKKTTREKPGKSPGTPQESPGTPVNFFLDLDHSGSKVFFPFRLFVSVKWPWRPERLLKLCLRALKLGGCHPQLKRLQKLLVCLDRLFGHTKKP